MQINPSTNSPSPKNSNTCNKNYTKIPKYHKENPIVEKFDDFHSSNKTRY